MSAVRLFVLGMLAERGPMHGHQIRNQAHSDRAELWTDVKVGALYGALRRLAGEGLIVEVRSERVGNLPERTVYAITPAGREALAAVHGDALRGVVFRPDPFDLALVRDAGLDEKELADAIHDRRAALAARESTVRHQTDAADPWLTEAERAVMGHTLARLRAELAWHDELLERLPAIVADRRGSASAGDGPSHARPGAASDEGEPR